MSQQMLDLFKRYDLVKKKREETYGMLYATTNMRVRNLLEAKAKKLDKEMYSLMRKTTALANKEGIKTKKVRQKKFK